MKHRSAAPLAVTDVTFTYAAGATPALSAASLTVRQGECVALCGASGCGKTTMTRLANGLVPSFFPGSLSGSVTVYDLDTTAVTPDVLTPLVGSVFQNPKTQYFNAGTTDELAFPAENMGMAPTAIRARIGRVTARFGIGHLLDRSVFHLSGGERQRLAVAAAAMLEPRLMVFDEPTGNLDQTAIGDLRAMLTDFKASGVTLIVAEHRLAWLTGLADRYVLFDGGCIVKDLTAQEFLDLGEAQRRELGLRALDLTPCRARIAALHEQSDDGSNAPSAPLDPSVPPASLSRSPVPASALGMPTIRTKSLVIGYRGKSAFSRPVPDLAFYGGHITALMGRNGCGKTTLVSTLTGLSKPRAGRILLDGRPARPAQLTREGFLVMQDVNHQLFADSVRDELLIGLDDDDPEAAARCEHILAALDLADVADRHPMALSGGQKQRCAIASALMCGKRFVVLDEPTSGLDLAHMEQVGALLSQLADSGAAVLVITHDEELAAGWCDTIIDLEHA